MSGYCQAGGCGDRFEGNVCRPSFLHARHRASRFPDYQVNICDFGAKSDGVTLNTEAINKAIKVVHDKGGGKVIIPEGLWLTGPIVLQSNVNLHAERML